ncbi:response regulator [Oligoflexus tunisiensis]|uniref:response regulator n=1 Tax=Oligoflexus tunisiensis TaxID=708132 RepID=UPI000AA8603B|nr:response regulator [Oligoflexus tunisiensis]
MIPGVKQKDSDLIPSIMRQLWVFLAYVAAARLALLLALPPGYASPIWPAAGIAIAATIVWGPSLSLAVFLGSIVTNLRPEELLRDPMNQILLQSGIALGSSVQAYLGSLIYHALDRRLPQTSRPLRLSCEAFLLGPVTCLTAATIGTGTLAAFHIIETRSILTNWIWWWLGDSFGAGGFVMLLIRLHRTWNPRQLRMKTWPWLLVPAGLSLSIIMVLVVQLTRNDRRHQSDLNHSVLDFHTRVQQETAHILRDFEMLVEFSRIVDPRELIAQEPARHQNRVQTHWIPYEAGHHHIPESLPPMESLLQKAWQSEMSWASPLLDHDGMKVIILVKKGMNSRFPGLFLRIVPVESLIQPALSQLDHPAFHVRLKPLDPTAQESWQGWFGTDLAEIPRIPLYGKFQHTLEVGPQALGLQVNFPAYTFHADRMGDPIFMTSLCMLLTFALNILLISQQKETSAALSRHQDILVVDDNLINQTETASLLTQLGFTVDTAADGVEALTKVRQKHYDVIFMDGRMPRMNGYEATQRIRALHQPKRGPLIFALTANSPEEIQEKAWQSGMDGVLTKPLAADALIRTIGPARHGPAFGNDLHLMDEKKPPRKDVA